VIRSQQRSPAEVSVVVERVDLNDSQAVITWAGYGTNLEMARSGPALDDAVPVS
jgi:hypothetical protein